MSASTTALKRAVLIASLLIMFLTSLSLLIPQTAAHAAVWCQCVDYVRNRYLLDGSVGYAKNMGPYLVERGFYQVPNPVVGAVVVFQPAFGTAINQTAGHVGVITSVEDLGTSWRITVRGANQGGNLFTEHNCTNVSNVRYAAYPKSWGASYISYYNPNLALKRYSRATSYEGAGYAARYGNDGNRSTRWSSSHSSTGGQWYIVDMGSAQTFNRVRIVWEAAYARRLFVGWSNDGQTFSGNWYTHSSNPGTGTYNFSGTRSARYVGIYMTERAGYANFSFWEVFVNKTY